MKIYNFNALKGQEKFSLNEYFADLSVRIASLYNYLFFFNPEYVLIDLPVNETEISEYKQYVSIYDSKEEKIGVIPIFFPTKLLFHQGFINLDKDGFLCARPLKDGSIEVLNSSYVLVSCLDGYQITIPGDPKPKVLDTINGYNFLSGYICFAMKHFSGDSQSDDSPAKKDLSNYSLLPIGNGSFYSYIGEGGTWRAKYIENEIGHFSNSISFNLDCGPKRYLLKQPCIWDTKGIPEKTKNIIEDDIIDVSGFNWDGSETIIAETYYNQEEVFRDDTVKIFGAIDKNYTRISFLSITNQTETQPKLGDIEVRLH